MLLIAAGVLLNVAFFFGTDHFANRRYRITVQVSGERFLGQLDDQVPSETLFPDQERTHIRIVPRPARRRIPQFEAGIDNIRLVAADGTVLFRESFRRRLPLKPFGTGSGMAENWRGHLVLHGTAAGDGFRVHGENWRDFTLTFDLLNTFGCDVWFSGADRGNAVKVVLDGPTVSWREVRAGREGMAIATSKVNALEPAWDEELSKFFRQLACPYQVGLGYAVQFVYRLLPFVGLILLMRAVSWLIQRCGWFPSHAMHPIAQWLTPPPTFGLFQRVWLGSTVVLLGILVILAVLPYTDARLWQLVRLPWLAAVRVNVPGWFAGGWRSPAWWVTVTWVIVCLGTCGRAAICRLREQWNPEVWSRRWLVIRTVLVLLIAAGAGLRSGYLAKGPFEGIPHIQDSVGYLMTAKALSAGHIGAPIEPELAPFFALKHNHVYSNGRMMGVYVNTALPGFPLLLSLGVRAGMPWIVNPLFAVLTLCLAYLAAQRLVGPVPALGTILLMAFSPWARAMAAEMLVHESLHCLLVAAFLGMLVRSWLAAVLAGLCLACAINIRPLDTVFFGAVPAVCLLGLLRERGWLRTCLTALVVLACFGIGVYLFWWQFVSFIGTASSKPVGMVQDAISPQHFYVTGMRLELLNGELLGWTLTWSSTALAILTLLPFRKRWFDWAAIVWVLSLISGYFFVYQYYGIVLGPRYYYGALFPLMFLSVRTLMNLAHAGQRMLYWLAPWRNRLVHGVALLCSVSALAVTLGPDLAYTAYDAHIRFTQQPYGYNFNNFNNRLLKRLDSYGITKGIIFLGKGARWNDEYVHIANNAPLLDGERIFALDQGERNHLLLNRYPDRPGYIYLWETEDYVLYPIRHTVGERTFEIGPEPFAPSQSVVRTVTLRDTNIMQPLQRPRGDPLWGDLYLSPANQLIALDQPLKQVLVCSTDGIIRRRLGLPWSGAGSAAAYEQVAADARGNVYVLGRRPDRILRYPLAAAGEVLDETAVWDIPPTVSAPMDIAVSATGELVVLDGAAPAIHVFSRDGQMLRSLAGRDQLRSHIADAHCLVPGPDDTWYVLGDERRKVFHLGPGGSLLAQATISESPVDNRTGQIGMATDGNGHVFVSEPRKTRILCVNVQTGRRTEFGSEDTVGNPTGLACNRAQLFAMAYHRKRVVPVPLNDIRLQ